MAEEGKNKMTAADHVLQIRLFAYGDTQRYRLGVNLDQLPTNRSFYTYNPTKRDGAANIMNYGNLPNYIPSSYGPKIIRPAQFEDRASHEEWLGRVTDFESQVTDSDFVQPRQFCHQLGKTEGQQKTFVYNVAVNLYGAISSVRYASYAIFKLIEKNLGEWVEIETEAMVKTNAAMEEIPGVVPGGKDDNPVPPTLPAPCTSIVSDVFEKIRDKFGDKLK